MQFYTDSLIHYHKNIGVIGIMLPTGTMAPLNNVRHGNKETILWNLIKSLSMMMSWHGKHSTLMTPLEVTGHRWFPLTKAGSFEVFILPRTHFWTRSRAGVITDALVLKWVHLYAIGFMKIYRGVMLKN